MHSHVDMMASAQHGVLYIDVANDLARRSHEHRSQPQGRFTARYGVARLVCYEADERVQEAIAREKMLKKWQRDWKVRLIEEFDPLWDDLYPTLAGL